MSPARHFTLKNTRSFLVATGTVLLLAACGGGGSWSGTKLLGVAGVATAGYAVATDGSGNVYVSGYTDGDLDGNTLTGYRDFFVTKYDSSGARQYTRQLGASGAYTNGNSVATDSSGNVYVAGNINGGLDGNTLTGTQDFFVTKYDSAGTKQYTKQLGASGAYTSGNSVATDSSGNVYVAGSTGGGLDSNPLTGTYDFFVTKYDSNLNKVKTTQLGVSGADTFGNGVATDSSGNVYVAGSTGGGLDSNPLTGTSDFFVTKYDSSLNKVKTTLLGVSGAITEGRAVATDSSGNVYVAGRTYGDLDGNTLTGTYDLFVTKYDSNLNKVKTTQLGVLGAVAYGASVATDASGNVYVAGYTTGDLDGNTLTGTQDFFVTKFSNDLTRQYTRLLGVAGADTYGNGVATDSSGNVFVAGEAYGNLDGNTLTGTGDMYVTKYSGSGVKQ